ncbi:hypothetical protein SAMN05443377_11731 [Propionibacterium cyclohexanicum]|uniref:Uncharacterized protein n=1 Tax=Propionibacterium cyclohexanicum TaxID=64702 RepID=A0A1H9SZF5_9ACTN|nr:hypothetical protein [Propionibacterium cyclohexanicum]SER90164.1 hypothetical protein SAMN05443377_11731 [Propionibacterium cyclohexanicum]
MNQTESHVTTRRSVPVGVFSLVVAAILSVVSGVWIRYGNFPSWLLPVALTLVEVGIGVIMLRPLRFRLVVDPAGIRVEGHAAWSLGAHEILAAGVLGGRHPTLWVKPTEQLARQERGFTHSASAPAGAHLVLVDPASAATIQRALAELGFADGSARLNHPRYQTVTGRVARVRAPLLGGRAQDIVAGRHDHPRHRAVSGHARRAAPDDAGPAPSWEEPRHASRAMRGSEDATSPPTGSPAERAERETSEALGSDRPAATNGARARRGSTQ